MKSRHWFQLHLSTLLVLSFTATGVMWLNVRCSPGSQFIADWKIAGADFDPVLGRTPTVGWPRAFVIQDYQVVYTEPAPGRVLPIFLPGGSRTNFHYKPLLIDVAVILLILLSVAVACEWTVRRRSGSSVSRANLAAADAPRP